MKKHNIIALSSIAFALSIGLTTACGTDSQTDQNASRATGSVALALQTTVNDIDYCVTGDIVITSVDDPGNIGPYTIDNNDCSDEPSLIPLLPGDYTLTIPNLACSMGATGETLSGTDSCELVGNMTDPTDPPQTIAFTINAGDPTEVELEFVFIDELEETPVLMSVGTVEIAMSEAPPTEETLCGDDVCLAGEELCATIDATSTDPGTPTCYALCELDATEDEMVCPTGLTGTCQMTAAPSEIGQIGGDLTYICNPI